MIRPIEAQDIPEVVRLTQAYIREACPDIMPSQWNAAMMVGAASMNTLSQVAIESGQVVGITLLRPIVEIETTVKTAHSMGTYVVPVYRGKRIAERLRREAMRRAKEEGFKQIQGFARARGNADAIVKLGGAITGFIVECPL